MTSPDSACGAGRAGPGALPCCCAVCPWTSHLPSLGFLDGTQGSASTCRDSLIQFPLEIPRLCRVRQEAGGAPEGWAVISGLSSHPRLPLLLRKSSGDAGGCLPSALWPVPVLEAGGARLEPPAPPPPGCVASEELPMSLRLELPQEARRS